MSHRLTRGVLALLLAGAGRVVHAQTATPPTGWFGGAHLGGSVGNYEIVNVANVGVGAFDASGAFGLSGGRMWRRAGVSLGADMQLFPTNAERADADGTITGGTTDTGRPARYVGMQALRLDVLVPLTPTTDAPYAVPDGPAQRVSLVAGVYGARFDGVLGSGDVATRGIGGDATLRGVGWSLGGQWERALGGPRWLVVDGRFERFTVTSGRVEPSPGITDVREPRGDGMTFTLRVGMRAFLTRNRE